MLHAHRNPPRGQPQGPVRRGAQVAPRSAHAAQPSAQGVLPSDSSAAPRFAAPRALPSAALRALLLLVAAGACQGDGRTLPDHPPPGTVERVDSAGVQIVVSHGPDRPLDWRAEEILRIGGADAGPENFVRLGRFQLDTDPAGNIHVQDVSDFRIHVFDRSGTHLRSFGGMGEGPGELRRFYRESLVATPDGATLVMDPMGQRVIRFDRDGRYLGSAPYPLRGLGREVAADEEGLIGIAFDEAIYDAVPPEVGGGSRLHTGERHNRLVRIPFAGEEGWGAPTTYAEVIEQPRRSHPDHECGWLRRTGAPIFYKPLYWTASRGRIGYSALEEYTIGLVDTDGSRMSIRRPFPEVEVTPALAAVEAGRWDSGAVCDLSDAEWAEARGWVDRVPWVRGLSLAPDGTWWVRRYDPSRFLVESGRPGGAGSWLKRTVAAVLARLPGASGAAKEPLALRIDVFAPDGEYLGTLSDDALPDSLLPIAWVDDREFIRMETDELGIPYVVVYGIVEG